MSVLAETTTGIVSFEAVRALEWSLEGFFSLGDRQMKLDLLMLRVSLGPTSLVPWFLRLFLFLPLLLPHLLSFS